MSNLVGLALALGTLARALALALAVGGAARSAALVALPTAFARFRYSIVDLAIASVLVDKRFCGCLSANLVFNHG